MTTYTPVGEWLAVPLAELRDWVDTVAAECEAAKRGG